MNIGKRKKLHQRALIVMELIDLCSESLYNAVNKLNLYRVNRNIDKFLFTNDLELMKRVDKYKAIHKYLEQRYKSIMTELYNPDYAKNENLWQTLNAVRFCLDANMQDDLRKFLPEIKDCLYNNKP